MSKSVISVVLTVYFLATLAAVFVRFDEFPFTWVPMYSAYAPRDLVEVPLRDKEDLEGGLLVANRDGAANRVTAHMLNLPSRNYWRIHLQRVAGQGAAKYAQARMGLSPLNQLLWGGRRDPENLEPVDWSRRVLESLNCTLGLHPNDPSFIIRAAAPATVVTINKKTMEVVETRRVSPELHWHERWNDEWDCNDGAGRT